MVTAKPQTILNRINEEVDELLSSGLNYIDPSSFLYRRLIKETESLIRVDSVRGYIAKAAVVHFTGDYKQALDLVKIAERIEPNNSDLGSVYCQILADLGYFSEAYNHYQERSLWEQGNSPVFVFSGGIMVGAIRTVKQRMIEAQTMNIVLPGQNYQSAVNLAVEVLDKTGTTESQITSIMDCAGEILRQNRIFQSDPEFPFKTHNNDNESFVHMEMLIKAPLTQVSDMNFALAELISQKIDVIPNGFHVSFTWAGK